MSMEIKFNEFAGAVKEQAEQRKQRLRSDFGTAILYVHLGLYTLFVGLLILKHFSII